MISTNWDVAQDIIRFNITCIFLFCYSKWVGVWWDIIFQNNYTGPLPGMICYDYNVFSASSDGSVA